MRFSNRITNNELIAFALFALALSLAFAFLSWMATSVVRAQSATGIIEGVVEDQNGAKLPDAAIRIVNAATNESRQTRSGADGSFRLEALSAGRYRVEVTLGGFAKKVVSDVQVEPAAPVKVTIALAPAGLTETVNVASEGQLLQTENSTQAATAAATSRSSRARARTSSTAWPRTSCRTKSSTPTNSF
ncbi:MAG: carboxypeptidase-like regulatory domain-containing protein [Blastocatellia bacterium]